MLFRDRREAGIQLAVRVAASEIHPAVVLGLARGGVTVAAQVATALEAPLDVAVARKIGAPGQPEFGLGAVTADGPAIFDEHSMAALGIAVADLEPICARERAEARRRLELYRGNRPVPKLTGRTVLLVDDGLATGVTARAALRDLRRHRPARLVFAAPVCAADSARALRAESDDVICLHAPASFGAVGAWYEDFDQVTDDEVRALLTAVAGPAHGRS
jgi:putative phosphoribosyl transferase